MLAIAILCIVVCTLLVSACLYDSIKLAHARDHWGMTVFWPIVVLLVVFSVLCTQLTASTQLLGEARALP